MKWILKLLLITSLPVMANEKIKSINFIQEGEVSKFIIKITGDTLVDKKEIKDDKLILLDVKNAKATKRVLRGIDTSQFKSSVIYISGYQSPANKNDIRFAINLRDNVRSRIDKNNDRIILSVENRFGVFDKAANRPNKKKTIGKYVDKNGNAINPGNLNIPKSDSVIDILANLVKAGPKKYIGRKISLNVREMPVTELLQILSEVSGFNIIVNEDVKKAPPMTLSLTQVPWDEALDTILKLSKLVAEKHSNILVVDTLINFSKQKEAELKEKELSRKQEPLVTKVFPISYAKLDDLLKILEGYSTEKRGKLTIDKRTNNIIVQDTVETIERMKRVVELLDTQTPQVLIEAKIVEATESFGQRIGLREGLQFGFSAGGGTLAINSAPAAGRSLVGANLTSPVTLNPLSLAGLTFDLELLEFNNEAKVISSPRVITENKQTAKIATTESRSQVVQTNNNGTTTSEVETVDASLTLDVTPNITNDGAIAMQVKINKTGFDPNGQRFDTNSRQVETNVLVDNGSTVVLGGIYQTTETKTESGIPILKDLPLLGWLFKTSYNPSTNKTELIVFLTPRIINQEEAGLTSRLQSEGIKASVKE